MLPISPKQSVPSSSRRAVFRRSRFPLVRPALALAATLLASLPAASPLSAQIWTGGGADNLVTNGLNWQGGVAPANNGTASLIFAGSTRLTPDLDADYSVASLQFSSAAGSFTLSSTGGHTLTVGGLIVSGNTTAVSPLTGAQVNPQTINVPLVLSADTLLAGVSTSYGMFTSLVLNGSLNTNGHLLNFSSPTGTQFNPATGQVNVLPIQINGQITGSGGIASSFVNFPPYSGFGNNSGQLLLTNNNTYTGATSLGYQIVLSGNNAALSGTSGIALSGGTLMAGDSASTAANPSRINDAAPLSINKGEFVLTGTDNAVTTREVIGSIAPLSGILDLSSSSANASILTLLPANGLRQVELVSTAGITRSVGGGLLFVRGANLGLAPAANTSRLLLGVTPTLIGGGGAAGTVNQSIVPYLFGNASSTGTVTDFVTYDSVNGVRPLNTATEMAQGLTAAAGNPTANVFQTSTVTLSGSQTINSLTMRTVSGNLRPVVTIPAGSVLTITSGGVNGVYLQGGTVNFGTAEGIMPSGLISSVVTGSGGLTLGNNTELDGANLYTGPTHVYGALYLQGASPLGASGAGNDTVLHAGSSLLLINATINDALQVLGPASLSLNGSGNPPSFVNTLNGAITLAGNASSVANLSIGGTPNPTFSLKVNSSITNTQQTGSPTLAVGNAYSRVSYNGIISDTGATPMAVTVSTESNAATDGLVFTAANSYRGGTTISSINTNGRFLVNNTTGSGTGSGNVAVTAITNGSTRYNAILGGNGRIDPSTGNTVQLSGRIAPGDPAVLNGVGTLTIGSVGSENDVIAAANSGFIFDLGAGANDKLAIFGGLTLNGANISIDLNDVGTTNGNGFFPLITYTTALTGSFSNLTLGARPTGWQGTLVNDTANKTIGYQLIAVPEPSVAVWVLAGLGGMAGWSLRRWARCL